MMKFYFPPLQTKLIKRWMITISHNKWKQWRDRRRKGLERERERKCESESERERGQREVVRESVSGSIY